MDTNNVIRILEKWSKKYKRSIDCSNPKGFSQRAHCAGRRKRKRGGKTKSRPIESFNQENIMSNLKEFVINEIEKNLIEEVKKNNVRKSAKNLFEAVNTLSEMKKKGDDKKIKMAESVVALAEKKLNEDFGEHEDCDCHEGEGEMFKAQLLSIMDHAQKLYHMIDEDDQFEDWVQSKITVAEDYIRACYGYLAYYNAGDDADFGDDDWDDDDDDYDMYDDVDEEDFPYEVETTDMGSIESALDPNVDDEMFEQKR